MNRQNRKKLVDEIASMLTNSGIRVAEAGNIGVEPGLATMDEFMTEYLHLQTALSRVKEHIQYCLGPTRDVKTHQLTECLDILTELVDKDEPKNKGNEAWPMN